MSSEAASPDMGDLKTLLGRVAAGERLSEHDAETAFDKLLLAFMEGWQQAWRT